MALMLIPLMIAMIYHSIHEGDASKKYVPELRKLAEQTPVYPGFQKKSENVVLKRSMASLSIDYKSNAQFSDIKKFYDRVLSEQGWRLTDHSETLLGNESASYRREDYEIDIGEGDSQGRYYIVFQWNPD